MLWWTLRQLRSEDSDTRIQAIKKLGTRGNVRAVEPLIAALKDEDQEVRSHAADALNHIKDARAVEPLMAALKDEQDSDVRGSIAFNLSLLDVGAAEPLLKDEDSRIRRGTALALYVHGEIGNARAFEPLMTALKDENQDVRDTAVSALGNLGKMGDARAIEPLIAAFKDEASSVRKGAAQALGWIGDARTIEPLVAALKDTDKDVREAAAKALELLSDSPTEAGQAALLAVAKQGSTEYVSQCFEPLEAISDDREWRNLELARLIPSLANAGQLDAAREAAEKCVAGLPDLYFGYYWLIWVLGKEGHRDRARAIGLEGLNKARRKFDLCESLGEMAYELGDLSEAIMWWIRDVRLRKALKAYQDNAAFLYLAFVSGELGLRDLASRFENIATSIARTDLSIEACAKLRALLSKADWDMLCAALSRLSTEWEQTPAKDPRVKEALSATLAEFGINLNAAFNAAERLVAPVQDPDALELLACEAWHYEVRYLAAKKLTEPRAVEAAVRSELGRANPSGSVLRALRDKVTDAQLLEEIAQCKARD